jgi:N-acetylmuramoyl-L-alanine amidase
MFIQSGKLYPDPIPYIQIPTSNYSYAYTMPVIDTIIIHYTAGNVNSPEGTISWFSNPASRVSAHLLIARDGRTWQFVPFTKPAYHSGSNTINYRSIGIELDNIGYERPGVTLAPENVVIGSHVKEPSIVRRWERYPEAQMKQLVSVCMLLMKTYPIKKIVGHEDILAYKLDPGFAFDWAWVKKELGI